MLNRGQKMLLAGVWAVLGACLAAVGCDTTMGPLAPDQMGGMPAQSGTTYPGQPYSPPAQAQFSGYGPVAARGASGVVQASHAEGAETGPAPKAYPGTGPAPTGPGVFGPDGMPLGDHGPGGDIPTDFRTTDDGSRAYFRSDKPLVPEDTDTADDLYEWRDGVTTLVTQ